MGHDDRLAVKFPIRAGNRQITKGAGTPSGSFSGLAAGLQKCWLQDHLLPCYRPV